MHNNIYVHVLVENIIYWDMYTKLNENLYVHVQFSAERLYPVSSCQSILLEK